ncbi:MAG: cation efflux system protein [Candidatus Nitrosocaldaceae archaeon]|nr:MAG: cation efflux system protein [Candidatus Nitrosocaldaceae archaeon]
MLKVKIEQSHAFLLSLLAIASVIIVEVSIGIISNSIAVISDGIHALFDALITGMLLIMMRLSLKPRDLEHTYGHGRLETIAGFIGGVMLFIVSILIIRESIMRIFFEEVNISNILSIYAVIYAIIIAIFRVVILQITNIHSKSVKVGLYDAVADLGSSSLALIAVILANYGFTIADGLASLVLAGMLLFLTSRLSYSTIMELTDAIDPILVKKARDAILSIDGVKSCKDIRMRKVGNDILVDAIVTLDSSLSFTRAHMLSNEIENAIKNAINASMVMVHFEPEEYMPIEDKVRDIAKSIDGVKDVHNIIISQTQEGKVISMHLQVDRGLSLVKAHEISDKVEEAIKNSIKNANVTIHIEPLMQEMKKMVKIDDESVKDIVKKLAKEEGIKSIEKIDIYSSGGIIRLDIHCSMDENMSIEDVHDTITKFERRLRDKFNAIVNIHTEPKK